MAASADIEVKKDVGSAQPDESAHPDLEPWIALLTHLRSLGLNKSADQLESELQGERERTMASFAFKPFL